MISELRLTAAVLLAGLAAFAIPSEVLAESKNSSWILRGIPNGHIQLLPGERLFALSFYEDGEELVGWISFECKPGDLVSKFRASVSTVKGEPTDEGDKNYYLPGGYKVIWTVDNGPSEESIWKPIPFINEEGIAINAEGLALVGQRAFDLALDILRAKEQIKIETPRGVLVNDLENSRTEILALLKYCDSG